MARPHFSELILGRRRQLGLSVQQASKILKLKEPVLIAFEGHNPLAVYGEVLRGVFVENRGLRNTATGATPLILMGCGLAIAYRSSLYTIGAEGQFVIGAVWWYARSSPQYPSSRERSRYHDRGSSSRERTFSMAASERVRGLAPGGQERHFCGPE